MENLTSHNQNLNTGHNDLKCHVCTQKKINECLYKWLNNTLHYLWYLPHSLWHWSVWSSGSMGWWLLSVSGTRYTDLRYQVKCICCWGEVLRVPSVPTHGCISHSSHDFIWKQCHCDDPGTGTQHGHYQEQPNPYGPCHSKHQCSLGWQQYFNPPDLHGPRPCLYTPSISPSELNWCLHKLLGSILKISGFDTSVVLE